MTKLPMVDVPRDKAGLLSDRVSIQVPVRQFRSIEHAVIAWYKDSSDAYAYDACTSR